MRDSGADGPGRRPLVVIVIVAGLLMCGGGGLFALSLLGDAARDAIRNETAAHDSDAAARREAAIRCVTTYFAGGDAEAAAEGTPELAEAFAGSELMTMRTRLGGVRGTIAETSYSTTGPKPGEWVTAKSLLRAGFERGFADVEVSFVRDARDGWRIDGMIVSPVERASSEAPGPGFHAGFDGIVRQTCEICRAVRFSLPGGTWRVVAGRQPDHEHLWKSGASQALRDEVADGTIVLLKKGRALAAVTVRNQVQTPEVMSFDSAWRDDGGTVLDPADRAVVTGKSERVTAIDLRGMHVEWSVADVGTGWLYFPRSAGETIGAGDVRICVTDRRNLAGLDAADPRWVFRASLSDEGVPAK